MKNILLTLIFLVFLSCALGQFSLLPIDALGVKLYLFDVLACVYTIVCLFYLLIIKKKIVLRPYMFYSLIFLFISLISLIYGSRVLSLSNILISGMYLIRLSLYVLVSILTYQLVNLFKDYREQLINIMLFSSLFVAISGFIQLVIFPNLSNLPPELGWDPHINRLTSTFFDPNFVGGYLVLSIVLFYYKISSINKTKSFSKYFGLYFTLVVLLSALFLTFSRSSWLMFAIFIFILGLFKSKKLLIVTIVLMFLIYYFIPRVQTRLSGVTDPSDSARLRLVSWKNTSSIAKDNLFLGVGFNAFRYAQEKYGYFDYRDLSGGHAGSGSDSSLLLVLATTGVIGFLSFCFMLIDVLKKSFTTYLDSHTTLSLVLFISVSSLLIHSQFVNSLFFPQIMLWLWTLIAISY